MRKLVALMLVACVGSLSGPANAAACDRACLTQLGNQLIDSLPSHRPYMLPLTTPYSATENSVGSALHMMTIWRTSTAVNSRYFVIDDVSQQVFFEASVAEGNTNMFVFGRFKVQDRQFAEIEIYENRSRSNGGFAFGGDGPGNLPPEWRGSVERKRIPSRGELLALGRASFGSGPVSLRGTTDCVIYENGATVAELPEVFAKVAGGPPPEDAPPKGRAFTPNKDGTLPIPCGLPPLRPHDELARTDIVDEVQGIVVSLGVASGASLPYLATDPAASAFVPSEIAAPFEALLAEQQSSGKRYGPFPKAMPSSGATAYVFRVFDQAIQGMQLLVNLGAPGGRSPWVKVN